MYSKTDTDTAEDGDIDDLVDLFRGLQKDMGDQKAETVRLKADSASHKEEAARLKADSASHKEETARLKADSASLIEEAARLKADSASHKEETPRLYRLLLLEEENRKDENENLKAETRQLKALITKEREERKAAVADLEGTIERQGVKLEECERELRNAKEKHDNDMQDNSEVRTTVLCSFSPPLFLTCPF